MHTKKENRAEIFAPYDSLKGFFDMIHEKERIVVEKKELSEDDLEILNYTFLQLKKNMVVKVTYFDGQDYIEKEGMIAKIDQDYTKTIRIVNETIYIDQITSIEIIKNNNS